MVAERSIGTASANQQQITTERNPPPGFEFVPIGHPKLTQACKDLSREQDAMIFIVSVGISTACLLLDLLTLSRTRRISKISIIT